MPKSTHQLVKDLRRGQVLHEKQDLIRFAGIQNAIDGHKDLMVQTIERVVKETVNGKIDGITKKLDVYIASDDKWKKEEAQPAINKAKYWTISVKAVVAFLVFVGVIAGILQLFLK